MSPPLNDDPELRVAFGRQRERDRAEAPAWRDAWLQRPRGAGNASPAAARTQWMPAVALAAGAACLALAVVAGWPLRPQEPRLSEVLPPLFEEAPAGGRTTALFAGREAAAFISLEAPSDVLLPDSLLTRSIFN